MSGHNKWSKIHRKKGEADALKGNIYARLAKEILAAVKQGGSGDPDQNSRLREVIVKARSNNMPNDNVKRAIAKALGDTADSNYENITYEGYGPFGVAVICEALTNNKNRTAGDMRSYFDKAGGALGGPGSVQFMFARKGVISVMSSAVSKLADPEEKILEILLDAPVDGITADGEKAVTITTKPEDFNAVISYLEKNAEWQALKGTDGSVTANIEWVPLSATAVPEGKQAAFERLIDNLENHEDVQAVYHNAE